MTVSRVMATMATVSTAWCFAVSAVMAQPVLTVNAAGTGPGIWSQAFADLQDALAFASESGGEVTEIWVASGTYTPDHATLDRAASFQLISGVGLYGGFSGVETVREQRDPDTYVTVLSGDLLGNDFTTGDNSDNSYRVVTADNTDASAVLDGFTVSGGNAYGPALAQRSGGGMYVVDAAPTIHRCVFDANVTSPTGGTFGGGAVYMLRSSPSFSDCRFSGNFAGAGGALLSIDSAPTCRGCVFNANDSFQGGAIRTVRSDLMMVNCVVAGNAVTAYGGALFNTDGFASLINCTVSGNQATNVGAGLYATGTGGLTVVNTIIWGNADDAVDESSQILVGGGVADVSHSCVQGWTGALGGEGNIGADPLFEGIDDVPGRFRLSAGSPCIDAGDNGAVADDVMTDLAGDPRYVENVGAVDAGSGTSPLVDMGAFEFQAVTADGVDDAPDEAATPVEKLQDLLTLIAELDLPDAVSRQLEERIHPVIDKLEDKNARNDTAAMNKLAALVNAVQAQKGRKIPSAEADTLLDVLAGVIAALNGG